MHPFIWPFVCVLYTKPVDVSKACSWVLWTVLANYPTWSGGGCGNSRGDGHVGQKCGCSQLAAGVGSARGLVGLSPYAHGARQNPDTEAEKQNRRLPQEVGRRRIRAVSRDARGFAGKKKKGIKTMPDTSRENEYNKKQPVAHIWLLTSWRSTLQQGFQWNNGAEASKSTQLQKSCN